MILVFDLDDTLFPEAEFVRGGFRAVDRHLSEAYGIQSFFVEAERLFQSQGSGRVFDDFLEGRLGHIPNALVPELVSVYRSHLPEIRPFEDAKWVLEHYSAEVPLALISDGYLQTQRNKVTALRIEEFFEVMLFTDEFGRENWKPSEYVFRRCMEMMGGTSEAYVYVGDNPLKDFIAPNSLGWTTVRVRRRNGVYAHIDAPLSHAAKLEVASLEDLPQLLDSNM